MLHLRPIPEQELPLAEGRGAALLHAVPVDVPLSEQFGWPARGPVAAAAPPCLRVHCPECGVAGAAWDLAVTCALCADDHESVLLLAGSTPVDAALRQVRCGKPAWQACVRSTAPALLSPACRSRWATSTRAPPPPTPTRMSSLSSCDASSAGRKAW